MENNFIKLLLLLVLIIGCTSVDVLSEGQNSDKSNNSNAYVNPTSKGGIWIYIDSLNIDSLLIKVPTELILWDSEDRLSWLDFLGEIQFKSKYKAKTFSKINFENTVSKDSIILKIPCFFVSNKSWVKNDFRENLLLLEHEQLHFDIAELVARKIREECAQHESTSLLESSVILQKIYDKFYGDFWDELNFAYDEETNHGINEGKQLEWEFKVKNELKLLKRYSSIIVVIPRL